MPKMQGVRCSKRVPCHVLFANQAQFKIMEKLFSDLPHVSSRAHGSTSSKLSSNCDMSHVGSKANTKVKSSKRVSNMGHVCSEAAKVQTIARKHFSNLRRTDQTAAICLHSCWRFRKKKLCRMWSTRHIEKRKFKIEISIQADVPWHAVHSTVDCWACSHAMQCSCALSLRYARLTHASHKYIPMIPMYIMWIT